MSDAVTLSIIMPCYNVADTIERALNSVFMQVTDFPYEVLIVDDASTDDGMVVYQRYQALHPEIKIICHESNTGNARSFYDGLSAAKGEFFCVLDGDDYYTIKDKLQRQIDFFRTDSRQEYVATAHYHILDLGDGQVNLPPTFPFTEYNYADFLTQNGGYFHTATYMYRNIFRGNVPEYFKEILYRGDTPRTTFHLMFSNGKIKILNFVGSVYTFIHKGIWSGMQEKQQFEYQIHYLTEHKKRVTTQFEKASIDRLIGVNKAKSLVCKDQLRKYEGIDLDTALARVRTLASRYAYGELDFVLNSLYYSEYIDSLCASLGCIYLLVHEEARQQTASEDQIAIVLGELRASGGGIFHEVTELIEMHREHQVTLFVTNMEQIPADGLERLSAYSNLEIVCPPMTGEGKLQYLAEAYCRVSPAKAYVYTSHNDTYAQALMQNGPCKNICIFSFDHGCICGISNPNYNCYIAKRPIDYDLLHKKLGDKVVYIPTWNADMGAGKPSYVPFNGHTKLITACAAARYYKVDGAKPYSYLDCVVSLLARTGGTHYHIGEIPEDKLREIHAALKKNGIPEKAFVHIPWSSDIAGTLLENKVDVFLEPFPIVSYKISLEVYSGGIPVFIYNGYRRMNITDFIYDQPLSWNNKEEFLKILCSVDAATLAEHSRRGREYFLQNHEISLLKPYFLREQAFCQPLSHRATDAALHEIRDFYHLFDNSSRINLMATVASQPKATSSASNAAVGRTGKQVSRNYRNLKEFLKRWDRKLRDKQAALRNAGKSHFLTKFLLLLSPYAIYLKLTGGKVHVTRKPRYRKKEMQHDVEVIKYYVRNLNKEVDTAKSSIAALSDQQTQIVNLQSTLNIKQSEMVDQQSTLNAKQSEMVEQQSTLNTKQFEMVEQQFTLNAKQSEMLEQQSMLNTKQSEMSRRQSIQLRNENELLYAESFNRAISNSSWLTNTSFSPGRWAMSFNALYVLYQILEKAKPRRILELGLGESTKMITQYAAVHSDVSHTVVEHDENWVHFFQQAFQIADTTQILHLDLETISYEGSHVISYHGFQEAVAGQQYDLIVVDGPFGSKENYSRVDLLGALPDCLEKSFVLLFDDFNRLPEQATVKKVCTALDDAQIPYETKVYSGAKDIEMITSPENKFLCSL